MPSSGWAEAPDFETEVRPILEGACIRCHGSGKDKGQLRLHEHAAAMAGGESGAAIVPGDPDASELLYRVSLPAEDNDAMPQETDPLAPDEVAILRRWIEAGARWPEGARLTPTETDALERASRAASPRAQRLLESPVPTSLAGVARRIDALIAAENEGQQLPRSTAIDDLTFLRRTTIDLIGRIPTMEEIDMFEAASPGTRREELVDRLLALPRFSDRWTVFFSDLLRIRSGAPGGEELLAYVHRSLEDHLPYDQLARELISASGRPSSNPAVGFILADEADPMTLAGATAQVFLGVRLACAECHDHPFDDWNQKQFYELAGFFGKTRKIDNDFARVTFATDAEEMAVLWPPERDHPGQRAPVDPLFPFRRVSYAPGEEPEFVRRFHAGRQRDSSPATPASPAGGETTLDALLDGNLGTSHGRADDLPDVLADARRDSAALGTASSLGQTSDLRAELAALITDPTNPYFARAMVNRVWFELIGRGFVEPLDDFSAYQSIAHPATLEFLAREFVAGGYDLRRLVRLIVSTEVYRQTHGSPDLAEAERDAAEAAFAIAPVRRMLSESLFDSVLVAGHLFDQKWPDGANVRTVSRQIRVPIGEAIMAADDGVPAPMMEESMRTDAAPGSVTGYDLEKSIELDFEAALSGVGESKEDAEAMRIAADEKLEAARRAAMEAQAAVRPPMRYRLETVEERVDDNPVYTSTMRMATPALPAHFLRVFGQPARDGLGEFRDDSPSLRQQLMMLNGKATHEAARVGLLEPLHKTIAENPDDATPAIRHAYRETLTRLPTPDELADARAIIAGARSTHDGMADLRWALLNSQEFRYLP